MKRWLYIIGILIIITLISVWLFLLFASDETKKDVYNTLGFQGSEENGIFDNLPLDIFPGEENPYKQLRQLTTRRVIGYTEVITASSTYVFFAEAGTGHIYKVNPTDGQEERVSNITVPVAKEADISPSGNFAVIISETNKEENATVINLSSETPDSYKLTDKVLDFEMKNDDVLEYSTPDGYYVTGKQFNTITKVSKIIFKIPFNEAKVMWGNKATNPIVYPKTSRFLEGYVYGIKDGLIQRLPASGYGLSALHTDSAILYQKQSDGGLKSYLWKKETGTTDRLFLSFFPEKCTFSNSGYSLYCGFSNNDQDMEFPDNWYRGEKRFSDELWITDTETGESKLLTDLTKESGRELDVVHITNNETALYFMNKSDQTIWVYDLVTPSSE